MKHKTMYVVMLDGHPVCGGTNRKAVVTKGRHLLERERVTLLDDPASQAPWTNERVERLVRIIPHAGR